MSPLVSSPNHLIQVKNFAYTRHCQRPHRLVLKPLNYKTEKAEEEHIDYYDLLKVPQNASVQQIKQSYRLLQKQYHPDTSGEQETSMLLNRAYVILTDEDSRKKYDGEFLRQKSKKRVSRVRELQRQEGLIKQVIPDMMISGVEVSSSEHTIEDIKTWLRQWCSTLAFGCDLPLSLPVQADPIPEGARLSFLVVDQNTLSSVAELQFKVRPQTSETDDDVVATVEIWRRVWNERAKQGTPGEKTILKNFDKAFNKYVQPKENQKQKVFVLAGVPAAIMGGMLHLLPVFGQDGDSGYEAYHLKPSLKMVENEKKL
eukprot:TRINITY_DN630_c0_g1_i2.p1 TRINITY_DN630_c0_g1~~TRINITY_DN630_c0_g1_i2.p1  ORF type:complete len:314 (-),score=30.93 TRINITY_DN630_c0_g1_i2:381-1322(-)